MKTLRALAMLLALAAAAPFAAAAPDDALAELRKALEAGNLEKAMGAGERAVAELPKSSEAQDLLGRAYGLTAKDSQLLEQVRLARKARQCFARAIELDPDNVAALSDLARYDMRAPAMLGGGKKKARANIDRVLALDPSRGHVLLGELAEREKDSKEAEIQYRLAIAAAPREPRGREALSTLLVSRKSFGEARSVWLEARELDPSGARPDYELAGIALASGDNLASAREDLEKALARGDVGDAPSRAEIHERLALVYEKMGRRKEAAAELETALALSPGRADWRKALGRLQK
jgi:Tfp pilus assembly protein PilF